MKQHVQNHGLVQGITLVKISLQCILNRFFLQYTGRSKCYFCHFQRIDFSNFKMTFAKTYIKNHPFYVRFPKFL